MFLVWGHMPASTVGRSQGSAAPGLQGPTGVTWSISPSVSLLYLSVFLYLPSFIPPSPLISFLCLCLFLSLLLSLSVSLFLSLFLSLSLSSLCLSLCLYLHLLSWVLRLHIHGNLSRHSQVSEVMQVNEQISFICSMLNLLKGNKTLLGQTSYQIWLYLKVIT